MIFIFDFDGVILDTDLVKYNLFKYLFRKENYKNQKKILNYHFLNQGINRKEKFKYILNKILKKNYINYNINKLEKKFNFLLQKRIFKSKFSTGVVKSLKFLKKKNIKMFVATGIAQQEINLIIRKLKLKKYFSKIYGHPIKKDKIIKLIKKNEKAKNFEIYFIGDSISDLNASNKTKIVFLGRRTTLNYKILKNNKNFIEKNIFKLVKKAYDNHYNLK